MPPDFDRALRRNDAFYARTKYYRLSGRGPAGRCRLSAGYFLRNESMQFNTQLCINAFCTAPRLASLWMMRYGGNGMSSCMSCVSIS